MTDKHHKTMIGDSLNQPTINVGFLESIFSYKWNDRQLSARTTVQYSFIYKAHSQDSDVPSDLPHGGIIMVGLLAGANLAETDYMISN